uniref:RabBD domain-containing protein n=1 Tax=Strongyloides venezuelensis TaxID=75913 RepID=A0A0K0F2T7_STRVS
MSKSDGSGKELGEMNCEEENKLVDVISADYEIKGIAFKKLRDAETKYREMERKLIIMKEEREKELGTNKYCSLCSNKFRIFDRIKICKNCKCQICKNCIDENMVCEYCKTKDIFLIKRKEFRTLCPYSITEFGIYKFLCKLEIWRQRAKLEVHMMRLLGDTFENCPIFIQINDSPLNECFKRLHKEISDYAFSNELSYINSAYRDFYRQLNRLWLTIPTKMTSKNRFVMNLVPVIRQKEESYPATKYFSAVAHAVAYKCEVILRQKLEIEHAKNVKLNNLSYIQSIPRFRNFNSYKNSYLYENTNRYLKKSDQCNTLSKIPLTKIASHKMSMIDLSSSTNTRILSPITRCSSVYVENQHDLFGKDKEQEVIEVCNGNNYMPPTQNSTKMSTVKKYIQDDSNLIKITMDRNKIKCQSGRMVVVTCKIHCPKETLLKKDNILWLSAKNKVVEIGGKNQFSIDGNNLQSNGYYELKLVLFDVNDSFNGSLGICALVNEKMYFNCCSLIVREEPFDTTEDCKFPKGIKINKKDDGIIVVEVQPEGYPTPYIEFLQNNKIVEEDSNHKITVKNGTWVLEISNMIQAVSTDNQFSHSTSSNIKSALSCFEIVAIARNRFGTATAKGILSNGDKKETQKNVIEYDSSLETVSISSSSII